MMLTRGFKHRFKDGVYELDGSFDEHADFSFLTKVAPPLRLNLRSVNQISSIGCRKWLTFLKSWGDKPLELYACPPPFISVLNMMPHALGLTENKENVRSILVPYSCKVCNLYNEFELSIAALPIKDGTVMTPDIDCPSCGTELRMVADPGDYFIFMTA